MFFASAVSQAAAADVPWPVAAQGRALPRPSWILVVTARRTAAGSLVIWDRADEWGRAWRVPRTVDGLRVVALYGDSEDDGNVTAREIDGMIIDKLEVVRRKYGAPAIALAVLSDDGAAVAAWVPGYSASWRSAKAGATVDETRETSVQVLSDMMRSGRAVAVQRAAQAGAGSARVADYRVRMDGGYDYRVVVKAANLDAAMALVGRVAEAPPSVESRGDGEARVVVASSMEASALRAALKGVGLSVE
jgi:hypothetical protein